MSPNLLRPNLLRPSPFAHLARGGARKVTSKAKAGDDDQQADPDDLVDEDDLEDDPNDDEQTRKAKKAKRKAKTDSEQDEKDEEDPKASAARQRERDRVVAILTCEGARQSGSMAAAAVQLATCTAMPRSKAITALATISGAYPLPPAAALGVGATPSAILAADAKARGERTSSPSVPPPQQDAHRASGAEIMAAARKAGLTN